MPLVSILIPVYNVEDYILQCLESVAYQTYTDPIECIIVDDCGNDNSIKIAQAFISNYTGNIDFKIIHHNYNRGLAAARNTAVAHAKGDFVMHLDSDDWLQSDAVELLISRQKETNADIVSGNALAHYNDYTIEMVEPDYKDNMAMVKSTINVSLDHVIWRRLIRRTLYTDYNITAVEGANIGEDHHTLPRLAYFAHKITKVDKIIYNYSSFGFRFQSASA